METGNIDPAELKLEDMTVLTLQDKDIVVIRIPEDSYDDEVVEHVQRYVLQHFQKHQINAMCMVIADSSSVSVLRAPPVERGEADTLAAAWEALR